ncbi:hypothetical protein [Streptomyces sp. NPDC060187]|uniref:hypothetical protein n=1 Tax=Streptomyces sp. NPDC060187 TaxID=3347067 RepID=UPI003657AFF5
MAEPRTSTAAAAPDSEESVRAEVRAVLGDYLLKALSVLIYLLVPALIVLAVLVASSGTYAVIAAALITASVALLLVGHKPWRHAVHRHAERAAERERLRSAQKPRKRWPR